MTPAKRLRQDLILLLCLPTAPVLLIGETETSAGLDFMGSFQTRTACLINDMAIRILSTMGAAFNSTRYLPACEWPFSPPGGAISIQAVARFARGALKWSFHSLIVDLSTRFNNE